GKVCDYFFHSRVLCLTVKKRDINQESLISAPPLQNCSIGGKKQHCWRCLVFFCLALQFFPFFLFDSYNPSVKDCLFHFFRTFCQRKFRAFRQRIKAFSPVILCFFFLFLIIYSLSLQISGKIPVLRFFRQFFPIISRRQ